MNNLANPSKSQFELHFKKWNFRKNLTSEEWSAVAHKIAKRKRDDKESEVYIDGLPMKLKKVKKAISRYRRTSSSQGKFTRIYSVNQMIAHSKGSTAATNTEGRHYFYAATCALHFATPTYLAVTGLLSTDRACIYPNEFHSFHAVRIDSQH